MKKFEWNTKLVYDLPYTIKPSNSTITIPNYEYHFKTVEEKISTMTEFKEANSYLSKIFSKKS